MVGQRQQTLALVYSGGGDFDVVGRPLHHLDALDGRKAGQILLRLFHRVEEHTELLHLVGVAAHPLTLVPQDGEAAIVGLDGLCSLHRRQTGEPLVEKRCCTVSRRARPSLKMFSLPGRPWNAS